MLMPSRKVGDSFRPTVSRSIYAARVRKSANGDDRKENFGTITRCLDAKGFEERTKEYARNFRDDTD
jgi:hypothetical protein